MDSTEHSLKFLICGGYNDSQGYMSRSMIFCTALTNLKASTLKSADPLRIADKFTQNQVFPLKDKTMAVVGFWGLHLFDKKSGVWVECD